MSSVVDVLVVRRLLHPFAPEPVKLPVLVSKTFCPDAENDTVNELPAGTDPPLATVAPFNRTVHCVDEVVCDVARPMMLVPDVSERLHREPWSM